MSLCVKRVPPIMRLFSSLRLMTLPPWFVRSPTPCIPMTISVLLVATYPCIMISKHEQVFRSEKCAHIPKSLSRPSFFRHEICHRAGDVLSALVPAAIKPFACSASLLLLGEVISMAIVSVAGTF